MEIIRKDIVREVTYKDLKYGDVFYDSDNSSVLFMKVSTNNSECNNVVCLKTFSSGYMTDDTRVVKLESKLVIE